MRRIPAAVAAVAMLMGCADETIAPPPNQAPVLSAVIPDQRLAGPDQTTTLDVAAHFSDPDDDVLAYAGTSADAAVVTVSMAESALTLTGGSAGGTASVTVTARDPEGAEAQAAFNAVVNRPPVATGGVPAKTIWHEATRADVDLTGAFSDPDGDPLAYAVTSSDPAVVSAGLHPGPVIGLAGPAQGTATITVTARDPDGQEAHAVFPVSVADNPDRATLAALAERLARLPDENWLPGVPLEDWYGVDLNDAGRVVRLGATRAKPGHLGEGETITFLSPTPPELGRLEALEFLAIRVGLGPVPSELGALARLKSLYLKGYLHGQIPPTLANLAALESLILQGWHLSGPVPSGLQHLSELTYLAISTHLPGGQIDLCVDSASLGDWLIKAIGYRPKWVRPCTGRAYLIQVVQSDDGSVPMVAGRPAALRLFDIAPPAHARFFLDGAEAHVADIHEVAFSAGGAVNSFPDTIAPAATIPVSVIKPGLEMVVEWGERGRFPSEGRQAIEVRKMRPLDLTLVPLVYNNPDRDDHMRRFLVSQVDNIAARLNEYGFRLLPAHEVNAKTYPITGVVEATGRGIHSGENFLYAVRMVRAKERGRGYWMGVVYGLGVGGVAELCGAVAWATQHAIQHELGHNLCLNHPPNPPPFSYPYSNCDPVASWDPDYPHPNGTIGAWGYNLRYPKFVPPTTPDLMTYCDDPERGLGPYPGYRVWISDYHYKRALDRRRYSPPLYDVATETPRVLIRRP